MRTRKEVISEIKKILPKNSTIKFSSDTREYENDDMKEGNGRFSEIIVIGPENKRCCKLSLIKYEDECFYRLEVDSIRYYALEKNCMLSGTEILKFIKRIYERKLVKYVMLEDAASFKLPGSSANINLTRFRKFMFGKGWYESHGFFSMENNRTYQRQFLNFQRNSINNLCCLLYVLIKDITMVYNNSILLRYHNMKDVPDDAIDSTINNVKKVLEKRFLKVQVQEFKIIEIFRRFIKHTDKFLDIVDIILKFGLYLPKESGKLYDVIKNPFPNNTCILKALTPSGARKIIDDTLKFEDSSEDTIEYIETIDFLLGIMDWLEIIHVPSILFLQKKSKTYKNTTKRCVKSYKKYIINN